MSAVVNRWPPLGETYHSENRALLYVVGTDAPVGYFGNCEIKLIPEQGAATTLRGAMRVQKIRSLVTWPRSEQAHRLISSARRRAKGNDDRGPKMLYLDMYVYRMPKSHRREFLRIERKANRIYRKFGGEGELLFFPRKSGKKSGMVNILGAIPPKEDEELWIGLYFYGDKKHAKEVSKMVDSDPEIRRLFKRFGELIQSASPVVQGELTRHLL